MKKILSYLVSIIFATVVLVYLSLAGYFWWEGNHLVQIVQNIDSIYKRDKTQHQITLLDHGLASFAKRIELIESAKKSIELEFFIYDLDLASRFLNLKLIEAAKRGVEIRILVDFSIAVFKFAPNYVKELSEYGIEVRYYNTAASSAIVSMQHRNHRKFLIIDGAGGIEQ